MKYDPHNNEKRFKKFEEEKKFIGFNGKTYGVIQLSDLNTKLIHEYLEDMKAGAYTFRKKPIKYARLNNIKQRLVWITKKLEDTYQLKNMCNLEQKQCLDFFNVLMREGEIKTIQNKKYTSVDSYVNVFCAFWHWFMRKANSLSVEEVAEQKNKKVELSYIETWRYNNPDKMIKDITIYVDNSKVKENTFVYFTIDDMRKLAKRSKFEYRVLMWFLFDSGIRSPTELMNVRVSDLEPMENSNNYELDIREETSKTFGRKIKLMLCSELLKDYITDKKLKDDDYLFTTKPRIVNQYFKRLFKKTFGNYKTKGGKEISEITSYDFRHSSSCYWIPRYKSESALKYRFGWKKSDMVHYYSKTLGMKDTIAEEDLLLDSEATTKLEKELEIQKKERAIMQDKITAMEKDFTDFKQHMKLIKLYKNKKKG